MVVRGCVGARCEADRATQSRWRIGAATLQVANVRTALLSSARVITLSLLLAALLIGLGGGGTAAQADDAEARALSRQSSSLGALRRREHPDSTADRPLTARYHTSLYLVGPEAAITVVAVQEYRPLADRLIKILEQTHQRYQRLFGAIPGFAVTLRLLDEETFFLSTGAPRWTNALFYRGQIIIPLPLEGAIDFDNVARSVRHEYTHAVIHALSDGKTPGWIDEGLAQLAEGAENPALRPALYDFLRHSQPVSFRLMQGGFTKMSSDMVAAAYAQSLIASQALLDTFGYQKMSQYFAALHAGAAHPEAFERVFEISEAGFEKHFARTLGQWAQRLESADRLPRDGTLLATGASAPLWEDEPARAQPNRQEAALD